MWQNHSFSEMKGFLNVALKRLSESNGVNVCRLHKPQTRLWWIALTWTSSRLPFYLREEKVRATLCVFIFFLNKLNIFRRKILQTWLFIYTLSIVGINATGFNYQNEDEKVTLCFPKSLQNGKKGMEPSLWGWTQSWCAGVVVEGCCTFMSYLTFFSTPNLYR